MGAAVAAAVKGYVGAGTIEMLRDAVARCHQKATTEASGGVTLDSVRRIAETGVDRISVGALTHSAPALDLALDFEGM